MQQPTLKKCKQLFEYQHLLLPLETPGGQRTNLLLNVAHFLTPAIVRHLWQL